MNKLVGATLSPDVFRQVETYLRSLIPSAKLDCLPKCLAAKLPWIEDVVLHVLGERSVLVEIKHSYPKCVDLSFYTNPIIEAHIPDGFRVCKEYLSVEPGSGALRKERLKSL